MHIASLLQLLRQMTRNMYHFNFSTKIINNGYELQGRQSIVAGIAKLVSTVSITGNLNLSTRINAGHWDPLSTLINWYLLSSTFETLLRCSSNDNGTVYSGKWNKGTDYSRKGKGMENNYRELISLMNSGIFCSLNKTKNQCKLNTQHLSRFYIESKIWNYIFLCATLEENSHIFGSFWPKPSLFNLVIQ